MVYLEAKDTTISVELSTSNVLLVTLQRGNSKSALTIVVVTCIYASSKLLESILRTNFIRGHRGKSGFSD